MNINKSMFYEIAFVAYDTLCHINIACNSALEAHKILDNAKETAYLVENTLSMFNKNSELSIMCDNYIPGEKYHISEMLFTFLELNLYIAKMTNGRFDPTIGKLVKLWNFLAENPEPPNKKQIDQLLPSVGYQHISLFPKEKSVIFDCEGVQLDPGAAGKGFALEQVVRNLHIYGIQEAVLDFGGNIFVLGGKRNDGIYSMQPWITGLRSPFIPSKIIGTIPLLNSGIATTSWYEHCFVKDGVTYYHILDPNTGFPLPLKLKSVSIISSSAVYTDILSTAFFVIGLEEGIKLITQLNITTGEKIEYVVALEDGEIYYSSGSGFIPLQIN